MYLNVLEKYYICVCVFVCGFFVFLFFVLFFCFSQLDIKLNLLWTHTVQLCEHSY